MAEERNLIQKLIKPETTRGKIWQTFVLIIVITVIATLIDAGKYYNQYVDKIAEKTGYSVQLPKTKEIPFILGLDLQGGTHLVYTADTSKIPQGKELDAVEGVRDVIERRVNTFGVSEPNITTSKTSEGKYRIIADLAGVSDVQKAIKMIGETPLLEFKKLDGTKTELTDEQKKEIETYNKEKEEKAGDVLGKVLSNGDFNVLEKEFDESDNKEPRWINSNDNPLIVEKIKDLKNGDVYNDLITLSDSFVIVKRDDSRIKKNQFTNENLKEVKASHILICYNGIKDCDSGLTKDEAYAKIKEIKEKATPANFEELAKENSTEPGADVHGGNLGWFGTGAMLKPFEDTVFKQKVGTISYVVETKFGYHIIYKEDERDVIEYQIEDIVFTKKQKSEYASPKENWVNTELSGKNLESANLEWGRIGTPQVGLQFNSEGAKLFEEITGENINNKIGIFLDGKVISAPTVNEKISGGKAVINGSFTIEEAKKLVKRLNQGALPVPIKLISQKTVGPTLGLQSVKDSFKASMIGLLSVAIFMILFYRLNGIFAVISLGVYGVLVLAVFKIFSVTLSLAGLAGFILSIGMAVDANVLIFERIKEELKRGKDKMTAIKEGFNKAWPSIRDGNFSTLITCFILMQFSTTLVRGFAITLGIGVFISLFSAMVVTKNLLLLFKK